MIELKVSGMTCGGCVRSVTNAVHGVAPELVEAVHVFEQPTGAGEQRGCDVGCLQVVGHRVSSY